MPYKVSKPSFSVKECGECKEWEAVEGNSEYIDHKEAERDMLEYLGKFDPAEVVSK